MHEHSFIAGVLHRCHGGGLPTCSLNAWTLFLRRCSPSLPWWATYLLVKHMNILFSQVFSIVAKVGYLPALKIHEHSFLAGVLCRCHGGLHTCSLNTWTFFPRKCFPSPSWSTSRRLWWWATYLLSIIHKHFFIAGVLRRLHVLLHGVRGGSLPAL